MIANLTQTRGPAFGFDVQGVLTEADTQSLIANLDHMIGNYKKPIGILADLTLMEGADFAARWNELRFLERYSAQIARLAICGATGWEELSTMVLVASAALQAQTLYFTSSERLHAWHWVKMLKHDEEMPVRIVFPGRGLFQDGGPEFMGI
jgi:hypothetical protein